MAAAHHHRKQTILITGANQGIGYHTALQLCAKGYHVTIACRHIERAKNACTSIINRLGYNASVDFVIVDFTQLSSVSKCARTLIAQKRCYNVIILNAGVLLPRISKTKDGFDTTFQVNYLSQFYLLNELLGVVTPKNGVKIVALTSILCKFMCRKISSKRDRLQETFSPHNGTSGWRSYARSKLATAMLACYLDRIDGIQAISVHPGAISTSLSNNISPRTKKFLKAVQISRLLTKVEDGARNVVESVEGCHTPNTFRNSNKYCTVPKRISNERNEINLLILSMEMITNSVPNFRPNPIIYNFY